VTQKDSSTEIAQLVAATVAPDLSVGDLNY